MNVSRLFWRTAAAVGLFVGSVCVVSERPASASTVAWPCYANMVQSYLRYNPNVTAGKVETWNFGPYGSCTYMYIGTNQVDFFGSIYSFGHVGMNAPCYACYWRVSDPQPYGAYGNRWYIDGEVDSNYGGTGMSQGYYE